MLSIYDKSTQYRNILSVREKVSEALIDKSNRRSEIKVSALMCVSALLI